MRPGDILDPSYVDDDVRKTADQYYEQVQGSSDIAGYDDMAIGRTVAYHAVAENQMLFPRYFTGLTEHRDDPVAENTDDLEQVVECYPTVYAELEETDALPHPINHAPEIIAETGLDTETEALTYSLISRADEEGLFSGQNPRSVAAGAVYLADHLVHRDTTQMKVAAAAKTTEPAIRNHRDRIADAVLK